MKTTKNNFRNTTKLLKNFKMTTNSDNVSCVDVPQIVIKTDNLEFPRIIENPRPARVNLFQSLYALTLIGLSYTAIVREKIS